MICLNILGDYGYSFQSFSLLGLLLMIFIIVFFVFLQWLISGKSISFKVKEDQNLGNYTLNLKHEEIIVIPETEKRVNILTKILVWVLSAFLIFIPLSKLLGIGDYWFM